ncbi:MAG: DUF937 domain-containing protein [Pseudomonadota bacterium]
MQPLFDMLANAQNGKGMDLLARQFNLSQQQTELAIEALTPAFSTGLKRNASDPMGVAGFMQALATGDHAKYYENMGNAFAPQGMADGNGILGHLFGSKDVSRAVAAQAAQATGIGQEIFKQMLPAIASTLMGGMFKQTTQPQMFGASSDGNVFGQVIEQMMKQSGQMADTMQQASPRNPNPFENPFGKALEQMFGGGNKPAAPEPEAQSQVPNPFDPSNNPFGKIFEEMMGAGKASQQEEPEPKRAPAKNSYEDLFGEMFETGRKQQEQYQKSVESIFDQYLDGMKRHQ